MLSGPSNVALDLSIIAQRELVRKIETLTSGEACYLMIDFSTRRRWRVVLATDNRPASSIFFALVQLFLEPFADAVS